jgi:hypothetical protein
LAENNQKWSKQGRVADKEQAKQWLRKQFTNDANLVIWTFRFVQKWRAQL